MAKRRRRVVVVGAGPNGLTAAAVMARAGCAVEVLEANDTIGGGARTEALTLPGFWHDVGSSAYPMGVASPVFRALGLERWGLRWVHGEAPLAHVMEAGERGPAAGSAVQHRDLAAMREELGAEDGAAWERLFRPFVEGWEELAPELLGPVLHVPRHPVGLARFGVRAVQPAAALAREVFQGERARGLLAGMAAHSVLPLERPLSAAVAMVLGAAGHAVGWPVAEGGAGAIAEALAGCVREAGGVIRTGVRVGSVRELGEADAVLCDTTPKGLLAMAEGELTASYAALLRRFRYGPGMFKVDWALRGPIPWADARVRGVTTVHVGGTMEEVAASERRMWTGGEAGAGVVVAGAKAGGAGWVPKRPFLILVQPSVADGTRAPADVGGGERGHTAWAYCHVPNGWEGDATAAIEAQVERFAPGFGERVMARHTMGTRALEVWDANLVGGDVSGGSMTAWQTVMRPTPRLYETSKAGLFLCSSSTPPGGGVHGMCGFHAAREALRFLGL